MATNTKNADFSLADPRDSLCRYLAHARSVHIDWRARKRLAATLGLDADYKLDLAIFDLWRNGVVSVDNDVLCLARPVRQAATAA
jgi:hypothetical protein